MAGASSCFPEGGDVLRSLLHSVSQPLTTLHCVLESSLEQAGKSQSEDILVALEETGRVMQAVRLMREYLEANQQPSSGMAVPVSLAIKDVLEQLSQFADCHGVKLLVYGASNAQLLVRDVWLQRILVYLMGSLIESAPAGRAITVLLEDHMSQSGMSAYILPVYPASDGPSPALGPNALRQAKLAIAQRALESLGASVKFDCGDKAGFAIRIEKPAVDQLSA